MSIARRSSSSSPAIIMTGLCLPCGLANDLGDGVVGYGLGRTGGREEARLLNFKDRVEGG